MRFEVYAHTSPSGKTYVGYSVNGMAARWRQHKKAARSGSPLPFHRAIRKHGPQSFASQVLDVLSTEAGAKAAERAWIRELGTFGKYNATRGGDGNAGGIPWNKGKRMSPEACAKNGAARRGVPLAPETRAKMSAAHSTPEALARAVARNLGRKHSAETRAKMSAAHSGRVMSTESVEKSAAKRRGAVRSPEVREQMRAAVLATSTPAERSARASHAAKELWRKRRGL